MRVRLWDGVGGGGGVGGGVGGGGGGGGGGALANRQAVKIPPALSLRESLRPRPAGGKGTRTTERPEREKT